MVVSDLTLLVGGEAIEIVIVDASALSRFIPRLDLLIVATAPHFNIIHFNIIYSFSLSLLPLHDLLQYWFVYLVL